MTNVIPIRLSLSNSFLVLGERPILVDTGSPKDGDRLLNGLAHHGVRGHDLALILHTHGHSDHCGSTQQLKESTSAPIAIHSADAAVMDNGQNQATKPTCLTARLLHLLVDDKFPSVRPDILVPDEMSLQAFGVDGKVVHTPGHTAGSISVLLTTGEAIVGDLLMGDWLGGMFRSGKPGYPYFADDLGQIRASVKKLLDIGATKFFVGHGGPLDAGRVGDWLGLVGAN
ncbi:MAG: MBL fold metallo-hydrolase [Planctomycetota bacterium]|nr:MBL fold metallo-hydrolase [Planctomycetota bacterium]